MQTVVNLFKNAKGLFWHDRFKSIIEAAVNLVASLILMRFMGIFGVLLGTTVSIVFVNVWYEPYILYKHGFNDKSLMKYMIEYGLYLLLAIAICVITFVSTAVLPMGFWWLCLKCLIALIIPNLIIILVFRKTQRFKYLTNFMVSILKRKKASVPAEEVKNDASTEQLIEEISEHVEEQPKEENEENLDGQIVEDSTEKLSDQPTD